MIAPYFLLSCNLPFSFPGAFIPCRALSPRFEKIFKKAEKSVYKFRLPW